MIKYKDVNLKECAINQCGKQLNLFFYHVSNWGIQKEIDLVDEVIETIKLCFDMSEIETIVVEFAKSKGEWVFSRYISDKTKWYIHNKSLVSAKYLLSKINKEFKTWKDSI